MANITKKIVTPFAQNGIKAEIPQTSATNNVNYTTGYTNDYRTPPAKGGKYIDLPSFNGILYDAFAAIQEIQNLIEKGELTAETVSGNVEASQVLFSDGQTFQEKLDSGTLKGPQGATGPQGPQGATGATGVAAGFGTPTATMDNNTGTPSVTVTTSGANTAKVFNFAFKNLKGPQGIQGPKGDTGATGATGANGVTPTIKAAAGANIGAVGTPTVTATTTGTTTTFTFNNLKGAKGDKGDTGANGQYVYNVYNGSALRVWAGPAASLPSSRDNSIIYMSY